MALYYTTREVREQDVTVELKAPEQWGMYTVAGNRSLTKLATKALVEVEEATQARPGARSRAAEQALLRFLKAWLRLSESPHRREATDTAVREAVGAFTDKLALASGYADAFSVLAAWDRLYERAQIDVREARARKATKLAKKAKGA